MPISLFGSASTPADNGTNTTQITAVTPPSDMQAGDLVWMTATNHGTSGNPAISEAGGQTWTTLTQRNATRCRMQNFWCIFNGTWSANPSVNFNGTTNNILRMMVWRPSGGVGSTWEVDVAESSNTYSAPGSAPYTVTIPQITTLINGALVIATWSSVDDNQWTGLTGSTHSWNDITVPSTISQIRNTSGTYDGSQSHAWMIDSAAGATGTVSRNQSLGGDVGAYCIMAFKEISAPISGAGNIDSGETFGGAKLFGKVLAVGAIASALAFGGSAIRGTVSAGNIASAEAFGSPGVHNLPMWLCGAVPSAEAFGEPAVRTFVASIGPAGNIASAEAFGTAKVNGSIIGAGGVPTDAALGGPKVHNIPLRLCGAIASVEALGSPTVKPYSATTISGAGGIASIEDLGAAVIKHGPIRNAGAISSGGAIGNPHVATPSAKALCGAVASEEAFGTPIVAEGGPRIFDAGAIASGQAFGTPRLQGPIQAGGIPSAEAFGIPWTYEINFCGNIESEETFGEPTIAAHAASQIRPGAIVSAGAVGTPRIVGRLAPTVIATGYASGAAKVIGRIRIIPSIGPDEVFGTPKLDGNVKGISGIASGEAFGTPNANPVIAQKINGTGRIASGEVFGPARLIQHISGLEGIASAEALGTPNPIGLVKPSSIASGENLPAPVVYNPEGIYGSAIVSTETFGVPTITATIVEVEPDVGTRHRNRYRALKNKYAGTRKRYVD